MEEILTYVPNMITLLVAFGGVAVVWGMFRSQLADARHEIELLRAWKDEHTKEGTELKTTVANMDGKLDLVLHKLDMNGSK